VGERRGEQLGLGGMGSAMEKVVTDRGGQMVDAHVCDEWLGGGC
jgi:hypothetical protein